MNPSDITPEIIATKIFGWGFSPEGALGDRAYWKDEHGLRAGALPTFLEPEWTGPLLAKAAEIGGEYRLSFREIYAGLHESGFRFLEIKYTFDIWGKDPFPKTASDFRLNYAIAGAILEAMGK